MRFIFVMFTLVLSVTSCSSKDCDIHEALINELTRNHIKKMAEKYDEKVAMLGGNCNDGRINFLGISFNKKGHFTLEEAREQIVLQVEEYLNEINKSEKVRPYLVKYPFTASNLSYDIAFMKENGKFQVLDKSNRNNSIANVLVHRGTIEYTFYDDPKYGLQLLHEEEYEDALEIVRKSGKLTSMEKQD